MKSKKYLDWLSRKPCLVTHSNHNKDLHHVKCIIRTGVRPPDYFCVPLDHELHLYDLHEGNEADFWEKYDIDILDTVIQLNIEFIEQCGRDKGYDQMFKLLRKSAGFNQEELDKVDFLERQLS